MCCVCLSYCVWECGSAGDGAFCCLGWFLNWESGLESATASPDWVKDKSTSGSVGEMQLCRAP